MSKSDWKPQSYLNYVEQFSADRNYYNEVVNSIKYCMDEEYDDTSISPIEALAKLTVILDHEFSHMKKYNIAPSTERLRRFRQVLNLETPTINGYPYAK